jgi:hypothetical protein
MNSGDVASHFPALVIFYLLQYWTLEAHFPGRAPLLAFASAVVLIVAYLAVRAMVSKATDAGRLLVTVYAAFVLLHAGYADSVPLRLMPWVGFGALVALSALAKVPKDASVPGVRSSSPRVGDLHSNRLTSAETGRSPDELLFALGVIFTRGTGFEKGGKAVSELPLYIGHLLIMSGAIHVLENRLAVSLVWEFWRLFPHRLPSPAKPDAGSIGAGLFAASANCPLRSIWRGAADSHRCLVVLELRCAGLLYQHRGLRP